MLAGTKELRIIFILAFSACNPASFGGGARQSDKANLEGQGPAQNEKVLAVGDTASLENEIYQGSGSQTKPKVTSVTSRDPGIASVSPDGTVSGESPGSTTVDVVYEDGSSASIPIRVTPTEGSGRGKPKSESDSESPFIGTGDKKQGCRVDGDKISWDWPKNIQDCMNAKKVWDFTRNTCTNINQATSFPCTFEGVSSVVDGFSANFTPEWEENRLKIVSCGERQVNSGASSSRTVIWQYIMLPKATPNGECNFSFGAGIALGCFKVTGFNLQSSDPAVIQRCMDDN